MNNIWTQAIPLSTFNLQSLYGLIFIELPSSVFLDSRESSPETGMSTFLNSALLGTSGGWFFIWKPSAKKMECVMLIEIRIKLITTDWIMQARNKDPKSKKRFKSLYMTWATQK